MKQKLLFFLSFIPLFVVSIHAMENGGRDLHLAVTTLGRYERTVPERLAWLAISPHDTSILEAQLIDEIRRNGHLLPNQRRELAMVPHTKKLQQFLNKVRERYPGIGYAFVDEHAPWVFNQAANRFAVASSIGDILLFDTETWKVIEILFTGKMAIQQIIYIDSQHLYMQTNQESYLLNLSSNNGFHLEKLMGE